VRALATILSDRAAPTRWRIAKRIAFGLAGIVLGGVFLWLALHGTDWHEGEAVVSQLNYTWLVIAISIYLPLPALGHTAPGRCILKWRHAAEALIAGYSAN